MNYKPEDVERLVDVARRVADHLPYNSRHQDDLLQAAKPFPFRNPKPEKVIANLSFGMSGISPEIAHRLMAMVDLMARLEAKIDAIAEKVKD